MHAPEEEEAERVAVMRRCAAIDAGRLELTGSTNAKNTTLATPAARNEVHSATRCHASAAICRPRSSCSRLRLRQAVHVGGHEVHLLRRAAGMRRHLPLRPFAMVSLIVCGEPPYSQMLSVRLGAPSAGLPLPSGAVAGGADRCEAAPCPLRRAIASCAAARQRSARSATTSSTPCAPSAGAQRRHHAAAAVGDRLPRSSPASPP